MFDSPAERSLVYRLSTAYDCWGQRRALRHGTRNGLWFLDPTGLDEPVGTTADTPACSREERLALFRRCGRFTATELATLEALVVERLTIDEIAARDGCTRQAVLARLAGNSRGQGGLLRKAQALLASAPLSDESVERLRDRAHT